MEQAAAGRIEKQAAIELIKLLGKQTEDPRKETAVIGMAFRLPKAESIEEFRKNIRDGAEIIREFPERRKQDAARILKMGNHAFEGHDFLKLAYLERIDGFDYPFFHISPKEAALMDPNQRIFLETAWNALEDAGYGSEKIKGTKTGVYLGYRSDHFYEYRDLIAQAEPDNIMRAYVPNMPAVIASRLAYLLNLRGPSIVIDTSCSSSLSAVHYACKGLLNHECDMAVAGGVKVNLLPVAIKEKLGVESSVGEVRTFDHTSDGAVMGEGSVALLLKPLKEAVRDRDNIYAVIKGSAVNHDGRSIGIAAPNAVAHEQVLAEAWEAAGIAPETIAYIEAHGTGTTLGDPIEIDGLTRAFGRYTNKKQFCGIATVKSWIGHLDNAAGIAGVVNGIIALKYKELPYLRFFSRPNANIRFQDSPLYVSARPAKWEAEEYPRRCGVSSFGMSGTNCHVVLEEYIPGGRQRPGGDGQAAGEEKNTRLFLFAVSAKTQDALAALLRAYETVLNREQEYRLSDICYTAGTGRFHFAYRLALCISDKAALRKKIRRLNEDWREALKDEDLFYGVQENALKKDLREFSARAARLVEADTLAGDRKGGSVRELCGLYAAGADLPWEKMFQGMGEARKVSLPGYPFRQERSWIELPERDRQEQEGMIPYQNVWHNRELAGSSGKPGGTVLVVENGGVLAEELVKRLSERGRRVIDVKENGGYCKVSREQYETGGSLADDSLLIQDLLEGSLLPDQILHMGTVGIQTERAAIQDLEGRLHRGLFSLLNLVRALAIHQVKNKMELLLITEYAHEVTGEERQILPENTAFAGLGRDLRWEYPNLGCRCIDIDETVSAEKLLRELDGGETVFQAAYRTGKRYIEYLTQKSWPEIPEAACPIQEGGAYLITGGTGEIGLEIMSHLAAGHKINLVSVNRTALPGREQWDAIVRAQSDQRLLHTIGRIRKIEAHGTRVCIIHADVSNEKQMEKVIQEVKNRFGPIRGIVHAAGIKRGKKIEETDEASMRNMLKPKVQGTLLLDQLTREEPPDFMLLCSSVAVLIGEYGNAGYTSANAFLDAFSAWRTKQGRRTLSVDWSTWDFTDMPYVQKPSAWKVDEGRLLFRRMPVEAALQALDKALSKELKQIVIGRLHDESGLLDLGEYLGMNLSPELEKARKAKKTGKETSAEQADRKLVLAGSADQAYTAIQRQIARGWSEVLGYEEINIHDNFFEIGGDSISISKLHGYLLEHYPYRIKVTDLFAYPTVYRLSEFLADAGKEEARKPRGRQTDEELAKKIDRLLESLEEGEVSVDVLADSFQKMGET
jgi:acyl transferase domain-containing protein